MRTIQTNGSAIALRPFGGLVDDLLNNTLGSWLENPRTSTAGSVPPVNILETQEAYLLDVLAPGYEKGDFKIKLEGRELLISGEKKQEKKDTKEENQEKHVLREFNLRSFKRSFLTDDKIDTAKITAAYENGVLKVTLPKKEELRQNKEIEIS